MQAVICPVCNKTGKVEDKTCHGCGGKGWVEVGDYIPYIPYIPPVEPYYPQYPWYPPWIATYTC